MERGTVYCFIFFQELCFSELLFFFIWLKLVLATFTLCFCALVKMSFPSSPASGRYSQYGAITVPVTVFALNFVIVGSWTIQSNYQQCQKIPCIIITPKKTNNTHFTRDTSSLPSCAPHLFILPRIKRATSEALANNSRMNKMPKMLKRETKSPGKVFFGLCSI